MIVDWSSLPNSNTSLLRAALVLEGRALSVYEEVHPKSKENNPRIHRLFLGTLKEIVPEWCCPIVITDAGFCIPWFKQVLSIGWDYVGRIRGDKWVNIESKWFKYKELFHTATSVPKSLGEGLLSKEKQFSTHFYWVKLLKKGRIHRNKIGKKVITKKIKNTLSHGMSLGYWCPR